jgi:hypothetical protein
MTKGIHGLKNAYELRTNKLPQAARLLLLLGATLHDVYGKILSKRGNGGPAPTR